jgi:hypothetical protein
VSTTTLHGEITYRLTPEQVVLIIARDMGVKPESIAVDFSVAVETIGPMEFPTQPKFIGCTVRKARP